MGRIGPLGAPCLEPAPRFAGGQKRIEQALSRFMGEQPLPKIVQQGEVKSRVGHLETERILPIYVAADRIRRLAIGVPSDILHHHDQRQAPGRDFHGTPRGRLQLNKELIAIEGAAPGAQRNVEVPFGERSLYGGHRRLGNRWQGLWAQGHDSPPRTGTTSASVTQTAHDKEAVYPGGDDSLT